MDEFSMVPSGGGHYLVKHNKNRHVYDVQVSAEVARAIDEAALRRERARSRRQCASAQLSPCPTSTSNGTSSFTAVSIASRIFFCIRPLAVSMFTV